MVRRAALCGALALIGGCYAKQVRELEGRVATQQGTIASLEEANRGCVVEVDVLREELARLDRENRELARTYAALLDQFGPRLEDGSVQLVLYPDRTVLALADEIHFATGSAALSEEGRDRLAELAAFLRAFPDRRFQVEGHTDPRPTSGTYANNWELGAQRAINVVRGLVREGVPEGALSAASFAATSPVASNAGADGMARNRRVSVAFQPTVDETAAHVALLERARSSRAARDAGGAPRDERVAEH